ncbi:unnamed protein product [Diplocarpon coronariae]|nr:hypothetical protein JHW43_008465 [Diplocarpon mali]
MCLQTASTFGKQLPPPDSPSTNQSNHGGGQADPASKHTLIRKENTQQAAKLRAEFRSPASALARYVDLKDSIQRREFWNAIKLVTPIRTLPSVTMLHLHLSSTCEDEWDHTDHLLRKEATAHLESRGLRPDDVVNWAWILSADQPDEVVDRFTSKSSEHPMFLYLEVLRNDLRYIESLERMLLYGWKNPLRRCTEAAASPRSKDPASKVLQDSVFCVMISRLLTQVRRIWPSAMTSVAHMASTYVQSLVAVRGEDPDNLSSLPASINPLQNTTHNWKAQKVLLELAGQYNPPLLLDKDSYQAVIRVLAASTKTAAESEAAAHRSRTWPPWRTVQDGMDAQRSLDDDLSRVLLAAFSSNEAGYRENSDDLAMKILGGQEMDGTPTIHTRQLVKHRAKQPGETFAAVNADSDQKLWAARVEATRDVREAWQAFVFCRDVCGRPKLALYLAMFRKLNSELARQGRKTKYRSLPGDGKEVLPVPDDNMSEFYKTHTQPPTLEALYHQMISSGLRPSGQCLHFLVRHARTPTNGLKYLRDSGLHSQALSYLFGGDENDSAPKYSSSRLVNDVDAHTLDAFIHLICRSAPRAVLARSERAERYKLNKARTYWANQQPKLKAPKQARWCIQDLSHVSNLPCLQDPIKHATRLLNETRSTFRPAWYTLFEALARRDVVISREHIRGPRNGKLVWLLTRDALRNFQECGLELDPGGFIWICHSFFKFGEAAQPVFEEYEVLLANGAQVLKDEFAKLSGSKEMPYWIPRLRHNMKSATLHMYVRCMGLAGELNEIISVLEWMVHHRAELEESNRQAKNGSKMLRRILVAARISMYGTEHEGRAIELMEQVEKWEWPDDSELESYSSYSDIEGDEERLI